MPEAEPLEAAPAPKPKTPEPAPEPAAPAPAVPARTGGALFDTGMGAGMGPPTGLIGQLARSSVEDRKAGIDDLNDRVGNRVVARQLATEMRASGRLLNRRVDSRVVERINNPDWAEAISEAATENGVPAALIKGIIAAESAGYPSAGKGGGGYKGLMQAGTSASHLDPLVSISEGTKHFKKLAGSIAKSLRKELATMGIPANDYTDARFAVIAILAYNAGPGVPLKAVKAAAKAGEVENWLSEKYYVPAVLYYGSFTHTYAKKRIWSMDTPELLEEYRKLLGIGWSPEMLKTDFELKGTEEQTLGSGYHFSEKRGAKNVGLVDRAVETARDRLRERVYKELHAKQKALKKAHEDMTIEEAEERHGSLVVLCGRQKFKNSEPYATKMREYYEYFLAQEVPPVDARGRPTGAPPMPVEDGSADGAAPADGASPARTGAGGVAPQGPVARSPMLSRQSSPAALPADVTTMSQTELEREATEIQGRLDEPHSYPTRAEDERRKQEVDAELARRIDALTERMPVAGITAHLDRLEKSARGEGSTGAVAIADATAAFKAAFAGRVAALKPGDPLPPDVKIVMQALLLWSTDPGNQWGEGVWDSRQLTLTAKEYATVPASHNKCNAYIAEAVNRATGVVHKGHSSAEQPGKWFPFRAAQWSDPAQAIPDFPVVTAPKMGDIIGFGGHVGVYLGTYASTAIYVSARDNAIGVHGSQHAHGIQIKAFPIADAKTFRRYTPGSAGGPPPGAASGAGGADAGVPPSTGGGGGPDAGPSDAGAPGGVP